MPGPPGQRAGNTSDPVKPPKQARFPQTASSNQQVAFDCLHMVVFSEKLARPVAGLCLAVSRSVLIKQDGGRHSAGSRVLRTQRV